jgi:hypothetical protein
MTTDEHIQALTKAIESLTTVQRGNGTRLDEIHAAMIATNAAIATTEQRVLQASAAAEQRAVERARDMQTEILRGIEAFARGNFSRMHRIETSDTDTNTRIGALEERVLYLETRRPPQ